MTEKKENLTKSKGNYALIVQDSGVQTIYHFLTYSAIDIALPVLKMFCFELLFF